MKHRGFNIKHIIRSTTNPQSAIATSPNNEDPTNNSDSFKEFFSMFKSFLETNTITKTARSNI